MANKLACSCIQMTIMGIIAYVSVWLSVGVFICWVWFSFFFLRLGLGQRRAVVIIGRWLLPSLVDTGDICCHYWQHILVSQEIPQPSTIEIDSKIAYVKFHTNLGDQWVKDDLLSFSDEQGDPPLERVLVLHKRQAMPYAMYRMISPDADDADEVKEYASLVGRTCSQRILLYRSWGTECDDPASRDRNWWHKASNIFKCCFFHKKH